MNDLPAIRTLGHRLDAIIIFTRRPARWWQRLLHMRGEEIRTLTWEPYERWLRYRNASVFYPVSPFQACIDLREMLGHQYQRAWTDAFRTSKNLPQFRNIRVDRRLRLVSSR